MSQSTSSSTTTPVTVICHSTSSLTTPVTMASILMGLLTTFGQYDVILLPLLTLRIHRRCCWPCHCATVTTLVPDIFSGICQLSHRSSAGGFSFRVEHPTDLLTYVRVCSGVCFLLSAAMLDAIFTNKGSTIWVCTTAALQCISMAGICQS